MQPSDPPYLARRERWMVALAVTAALAAWEVLLDRAVNGAAARAAGALARTLLLDAALGLPLAFLALLAATAFWRGVAPWRRAAAGVVAKAAVAALALGVLMIPVALLRQRALAAAGLAPPAGGGADAIGGTVSAGAWLCSAVGTSRAGETGAWSAFAASAQAALLVEAAAFPAFGAAIALARRRAGAGARWLATAAGASGAIAAAGVLLAAAPGRDGAGPPVAAAAPACRAGRPVRTYEVSAIEVDIPLNRWGGHDPNGLMYALDASLPAIRAQERVPLPERVSTGLGADAIQPLVLRANAGECLVVSFTNRLREGDAGFEVHGLPAAGGDARARPGEKVTYAFEIPPGAPSERTYAVQDPRDAATRGVEGLFGALVVEPEGSIHRDPRTGAPLERSSWDAIIEVRDGEDFREFVLVYHELGNALGVNYRSEDLRSRFEAGGVDEANAYSSYTYGDPATPILRSYVGERTVLRVLHGSGAAYYVHHLHGNAIEWRQTQRARPSAVAFGWLDQPMLERPTSAEQARRSGLPRLAYDDEDPQHMWIQIDALAFSPGGERDARIACGAGGCQRAAGDFLYHSHVPQHAERGMWGLWRVFDTRQEGLAPLPDREAPPRAVTSAGLLGRVIDGKRVVRAAQLRDRTAEQPLEELVERQLPPRGERLDARDAAVWDWSRIETPEGPLYVGEPDAREGWPAFRPQPGRRPPILFDPETGRYAWPLFRPHLGMRPPFSPAGHTGAPWLGEHATTLRPGGVCPATDLLHAPDRRTRVFSVAARRGQVLGRDSPVVYDTHGKPKPLERRRPDGQRYPVVLVGHVGQCMDVLFVNDGGGERRHVDVHAHDLWGDPQASDGIAAGFSFAQQVEPYRSSQRVVTAASAPGATALELSNVARLRPGVWVGVGLGEGFCATGEAAPDPGAPAGAPPPDAVRCTEIRRIAAVEGKRVVLDAPLRFAHGAGQFVDVEFLRFLWFVPSRRPEPVSARVAANRGAPGRP